MNEFNYFSLVRKSDNKEVYTSPEYKLDGTDVLDRTRIESTLSYYFKRVNGFTFQQMQSPKLTDEQKANLRILKAEDYVVKFKKFTLVGMAPIVYWTNEATGWIKDDNYDV